MIWNRTHTLIALLAIASTFFTEQGAGLDAQTVSLMQAMQRDDLASVKSAVEKNPKLVSRPLTGTDTVPLGYAIQNQKMKVAKWLLQQDAPIGKIRGRTTTPIQFALKGRNEAMIDLILDNRPDINTSGDNGDTPIMTAIKYRHHKLEMIDRLLKKGASLNSVNRSRQTPLHLACYYHRIDVAEMLIEAGAKLNSVDSGGNTPFHAACMSSPELVATFMKRGANPNRLNQQKQNALHLLCQSSVESSVNLVIEHIKNLNQTDSNGETPLTLAVSRRKPSIVKLLIENGADPNFVTRRSYGGNTTPLLMAASAGEPVIVEMLLSAKAKPNVMGRDGNSPMHAAIIGASDYLANMMNRNNPSIGKRTQQFTEIVKQLLSHDAEVNMLNHSGKTPIQLAAEGGFLDAVELLVDKSNSLNFSVGDSSLLHWSARNGLVRTAKKLFEADTNINQLDSTKQTALMLATNNGHADMVRFLLGKGADAGKTDADGMTPLMHAGNLGSVAITKALINAKVDVNRQDPGGHTAIHFAAWSGAEKVIDLLAKGGANVNALTPSGYSPLMASAWNGRLEACKALQQHGARVNQVDSDGWSALHKAAYRGHTSVVKWLLKNGAKQMANTAGMTPKSLVPKSNQELLALLD